MNLRSALIPAAALGLAVALAFTPLTGAQTAPASTGAIRIAVANPAKIFAELKETKDVTEKMKADQSNLAQQQQSKAQKLNDLKSALQLLKPDAPGYADKQRELVTASIEAETWAKISDAEFKRNQRVIMKSVFDKIQAATAQVAQQKGIDLVIADQRPQIPDNVDQLSIELLQQLISARTVLYATAPVDISSDVAAVLDAQYTKK
jgi:Skp family chaperone for outer membrane proteins